MPQLKERAMQGAVRLFHALRMLVVACVCLLIGVCARHLIDAYGPEVVSSLRKARLNAEVPVTPAHDEDLSAHIEPMGPHWN